MSNAITRNHIRNSDANASHLLRVSTLYNGATPLDEDSADLPTRFSVIRAVRIA